MEKTHFKPFIIAYYYGYCKYWEVSAVFGCHHRQSQLAILSRISRRILSLSLLASASKLTLVPSFSPCTVVTLRTDKCVYWAASRDTSPSRATGMSRGESPLRLNTNNAHGQKHITSSLETSPASSYSASPLPPDTEEEEEEEHFLDTVSCHRPVFC